VAETVN